ncbi:circularly permuted type 2 ATP-grasp protein [Klebsiella pneumoniae]
MSRISCAIPAEQVLANEQDQPCMQGINLPNNTYAHITGVDMVRNNDGQYYVPEDNLRTPSGAAPFLINRSALSTSSTPICCARKLCSK